MREPQCHSEPSERTATVKLPEASEVKPPVTATWVGVVRAVVELSPSTPEVLSPQP